MGCEQLATKADVQAIDRRLQSIESKLSNLPDKTFLQNLIGDLKNSIKGYFETLSSLVKANHDFVIKLVQELKGLIENVLKQIIDLIKKSQDTILDFLKTWINFLLDAIKAIFGTSEQKGIDYQKIEGMHQKTRDTIIFYIAPALEKLYQSISKLYSIHSKEITALYNNIKALLDKLKTAPIDYSKIEAMHQKTRDLINKLYGIHSKEITALYNNIKDLLDKLKTASIDYSKIEQMHEKTRQIVKDWIDGAKNQILAAIAFNKLLDALEDVILKAFDKIIDKFDKILQALDAISKILEILNSLKNLFEKQPQIDYDKITNNVVTGIKAALVTNFNNLSGKIQFQTNLIGDKIDSLQLEFAPQLDLLVQKVNFDYSKIEAMHEKTREYIKDRINYLSDKLTGYAVQILDAIKGLKLDPIDYSRINKHTTERIDWLHQQILDLHKIVSGSFTALYKNIRDYLDGKFGIKATTHTGTCVDGTYVDVESESFTIFGSISSLSNQVKAFQTGSCATSANNEVVVGLIAAEKELLAITGNQLVLHFVTEDNYPKRKAGSSYRPIQIPAPKATYDWDTHFEGMQWQAGNQYAALKLVGWKNSISGWFASKDAANSYFNYLLDNILDENVEVDNIIVPDHSNPKTNVAVQIWRPYRAFLMAAPNNDNTTVCLEQYHPSSTPTPSTP